jgi:hypothetical protein
MQRRGKGGRGEVALRWESRGGESSDGGEGKGVEIVWCYQGRQC